MRALSWLARAIDWLAVPVLSAFAEMRARPGRTALQMAGVLLGVASIVACLTIVHANRTQSLKFFEKFGGLRKVLVRNHESTALQKTALESSSVGLTLDDVAMLEAEGTAFDVVDPIAGAELMLRTGRDSRRWWVQGVRPSFRDVYEIEPAEGRFLNERDVAQAARVIVLGDTSARRMFGSQKAVGQIVDVEGQGFEVIGVLRRKEYRFGPGGQNALEWMNEYVLMPLTAMTRRVRGDPKGRIDWLNVMALDGDHADKAAAEAERILLKAHGGVHDFEVVNRKARVQQMQQQMMAFNVTFLVAAAVSLMVGGIVITNILLASFQTRVREIGVRKALGASDATVFLQFLTESSVMTATAGMLGLFLGWDPLESTCRHASLSIL